MHKLTTKELTELEDIVRKSIDTFIENSGDTRGEEALKAIAKESPQLRKFKELLVGAKM